MSDALGARHVSVIVPWVGAPSMILGVTAALLACGAGNTRDAGVGCDHGHPPTGTAATSRESKPATTIVEYLTLRQKVFMRHLKGSIIALRIRFRRRCAISCKPEAPTQAVKKQPVRMNGLFF